MTMEDPFSRELYEALENKNPEVVSEVLWKLAGEMVKAEEGLSTEEALQKLQNVLERI